MKSNDYSVEIFPLAEQELDNIFRYYFDLLESNKAKSILMKLHNAILSLAFMPKSHPKAQERRL